MLNDFARKWLQSLQENILKSFPEGPIPEMIKMCEWYIMILIGQTSQQVTKFGTKRL